MSSYGASCSTCFPAASFAFATSASSPIASERRFFHSVSVYFSNQHGHKHESLRRPRPPLSCSASVLSAAESCVLSSGFPPRNFSSDLRPIPSAGQHDSTSPASNLIRVPARTLVLRLALLQTRTPSSVQALRCTSPWRLPLRESSKTAAQPPQGQSRGSFEPAQPHSNPIARRFLQVAVSKAPAHRNVIHDSSQGRFRYSPRTSGQLRNPPFAVARFGRPMNRTLISMRRKLPVSGCPSLDKRTKRTVRSMRQARAYALVNVGL